MLVKGSAGRRGGTAAAARWEATRRQAQRAGGRHPQAAPRQLHPKQACNDSLQAILSHPSPAQATPSPPAGDDVSGQRLPEQRLQRGQLQDQRLHAPGPHRHRVAALPALACGRGQGVQAAELAEAGQWRGRAQRPLQLPPANRSSTASPPPTAAKQNPTKQRAGQPTDGRDVQAGNVGVKLQPPLLCNGPLLQLQVHQRAPAHCHHQLLCCAGAAQEGRAGSGAGGGSGGGAIGQNMPLPGGGGGRSASRNAAEAQPRLQRGLRRHAALDEPAQERSRRPPPWLVPVGQWDRFAGSSSLTARRPRRPRCRRRLRGCILLVHSHGKNHTCVGEAAATVMRPAAPGSHCAASCCVAQSTRRAPAAVTCRNWSCSVLAQQSVCRVRKGREGGVERGAGPCRNAGGGGLNCREHRAAPGHLKHGTTKCSSSSSTPGRRR